MLLMECCQVKKYFGDRLILDIEDLKVYTDERIGIVGRNGVGKTTLVNLFTAKVTADEGFVKVYQTPSYISQLETPESKVISDEMASRLSVDTNWKEEMSGGEKTRFKLAQALEHNAKWLIADEPTSNVDMQGIEWMEQNFLKYKGALILISHDRSFLDRLCHQIWEIEDGKVVVYKGNYSDYTAQKREKQQRVEFEYQAYMKEKKRLQQVVADTKQKVKSMKKTPNRMGNSEARLHKMGPQRSKANLERAAKSVEKRMEQLTVKDKPKTQQSIKLEILDANKIYSKIIIEGKNINKAFGRKILLKDADFRIGKGDKVALMGANGCGKTTLVKMIMSQDSAIQMASGSKVGYFSQDMDILNNDLTIIENVMKTSVYLEGFARLVLGRLLFKGEEVYKKIDLLSGGERVKVSLAKILLSDMNLLILDEPTNYLDIQSMEVLDQMLKEYEQTLLFISHDRRLIESVADHIMVIENQKISMFDGDYKQYLERNTKGINNSQKQREQQILLLKNRLSEIIGRLSMPSKNDDIAVLDQQYYELLEQLKRLKA